MPLVLETPGSTRDAIQSSTRTIEIALLNNLGDAGLETGERQIVELLAEASGQSHVRLRFFSLPHIARGPQARARLDARYTPFSDLTRSRIDGLIVTGCEPRAASLPEESFWKGLTEVIDWAEHNTRSTIWSCLAAHAAVLHLDAVARRPLPEKCTGVFQVERVAEHSLTSGLRAPLLVPHSRWNGLREDDLVAAGYEILTRSPAVGVDMFVKQWRSLFVYLQGHPEYDAEALGREYRRDVTRYLAGATPTFPAMPRGYFDAETEAALHDFAGRGVPGREPSRAKAFPVALGGAHRPWRRRVASALFRNWLETLRSADAHGG
jgi:homoserine O-succinyltransferase